MNLSRKCTIYLLSLLPGDLDILTALLVESEGIGEKKDSQDVDLDGLFDDSNDDEEEYNDGIEEESKDVDTEEPLSDLFGDVDDIESEEKEKFTKGEEGGEVCKSLDRSKEDLQGLWHCSLPSDPNSLSLTLTLPADGWCNLVQLNLSLNQQLNLSLRHISKSKVSISIWFSKFFQFRKPRISSTDMDRKMADRRLIRLSELPERLPRENLEESDWVTFAVLVNKTTQQSNSSGKTFSIWKLNDLHNLEMFVSLLLFGEVHKEHWKTELGTVFGILNPNPMKQRDGYDGVSLTVDHPQKVLLMGEAQDFGTCKAAKKNGDPCSQIVNMCQFCQYHVKAEYKKMSSKRAELQSSFSGKAPNKVKGSSLRQRLCQDGFHYGGMSSAACAASRKKKKKKKIFFTFSSIVIFLLAMQSGDVSGCSNEFKSLMLMPTPGALQLKKHLTQDTTKDATGGPLLSISASDLLKQQKHKQQELLQNRRRRAEDFQKRVLESSAGPRPGSSSVPSLGRDSPTSPKATPEVPKAPQSPAAPHAPTLGRGFSEGEDILFFENSPPPAPAPSTLSLSTAKLAALKKLRKKGVGLEKEDPNAVKRKRSNNVEISARVEKNLTSPNEEPAQKRKREQLLYIQSEEFQTILNAKSRHGALLQAAEYQLQEDYFNVLLKKEQMEEKMRGIREMKCRAVTCKKCSYTYFKPADRCVEQNHVLRWHDAIKRFFKCPCGQRAIALDRLPNKHCTNCGLFKWERDGMLKEKAGPKLGGELLLPRGEEHAKFLSSMN
uniref:Protein MCM10 homolog n=1 Tax=Mola mola TaxID=94237 RepID=A0A3Q3WFD9_MOLML